MMQPERERNRVHSEASLTLEIFGGHKDNQHKAQISSTYINITKLPVQLCSVNKCKYKVKDSEL